MDDRASLQYWFGAHSCATTAIATIGDIRTEELKEPVAAFVQSASRVDFLSRYAFDLFEFGRRFKLAEIAANLLRFGDPCYYLGQ